MPTDSPNSKPGDLPPIGLIAGGGRLPILEAQGIRAAGRRVACVGFSDQFDPQLPSICDHFAAAGVAQPGKWIRHLRRFGAHEAILVGSVKKTTIFDPFRMVRQIPDWRAAKLWFGKFRKDRRTHAMLGALADELQSGGITLIDTTKYIQDAVPGPGVLTRRQPTSEQWKDIEFGWPILLRLNELDIGQAIAVKEREVIAVEAVEGTDAMIKRAGELCRLKGWILMKAAMPNQDMRLDVPTVGPLTLENMRACRGQCLVVQAGKVIAVDLSKLIRQADESGISIVGM